MLNVSLDQHATASGVLQNLSAWVPGLYLHLNFLDPAMCTSLWSYLYSRPWRNDVCNPKRTQHYGNSYPEISAEPDPERQSEVPRIVQAVLNRLRVYFGEDPNEIMVIEYRPEHGLDPHIDGALWGEVIGSLSLGREAVMQFSSSEAPDYAVDIPLPEGSLLLMTGPARWNWFHGLPVPAFSDSRNRVSLTFRTLAAEGIKKAEAMRHIPGAAAGQIVGG